MKRKFREQFLGKFQLRFKVFTEALVQEKRLKER